jgi:hypothetical protein
MSLLRVLLTSVAFFAMVGCSDTVEDRYATKAAARADSLFERGWLPDSRDIVTKNDLELNISTGSFHFSKDDSADFIRHLRGSRTVDGRYSSFSYSNKEATWFFEVDFDQGHCQYSMTYKRPDTSKQVGLPKP